jgi:hypothetical protein
MLIHTTSPSPHTEEDFNENSYVLMSSSLHSEADAPEHHDLSILRARYRGESEEALSEARATMSTGSSIAADSETHLAGKRAAQTLNNTHTASAASPTHMLPTHFINTVIKKWQGAYVHGEDVAETFKYTYLQYAKSTATHRASRSAAATPTATHTCALRSVFSSGSHNLTHPPNADTTHDANYIC